jgi:Protein of unknown function (DUF1569)
VSPDERDVRKSLGNPVNAQEIRFRLAQLSPEDAARWGSMSVHQMICHLDDSYKLALGQRTATPATGLMQRTLVKWVALRAPMQWPKGVPTRPEMEQGKGGSTPVGFAPDLASLLSTFGCFCAGLFVPPVLHPIFGKMTTVDWMRWGYLHADHHLRQFGR